MPGCQGRLCGERYGVPVRASAAGAFFGVERIWMGDARVSITDLERTLLESKGRIAIGGPNG